MPSFILMVAGEVLESCLPQGKFEESQSLPPGLSAPPPPRQTPAASQALSWVLPPAL